MAEAEAEAETAAAAAAVKSDRYSSWPVWARI